jgi:hypothetical protein
MKHSITNCLRKAAFTALILAPLATFAQQPKIQYLRAYDQTGINVFETPKQTDVKFDGLKVRFGAGFTQQFQAIKSENPGALNNGGTTAATAGANKLYPLKPGFMTAQANLFTDVQLADGIRLSLTTYLSARHHNEAWVKGGYIQFDKLPFKGKFWDNLMSVTTIKVGHMEINYGDAHFRRPDGGQTLYSPFMEGNIMDEFATEIGGEVYVQKNGLFGMLGVTNGMIKGSIDTVIAAAVDKGTTKKPSIYLKAGFDKNITENVRLRLTGSYYHNGGTYGSGLTLFGGDRTGSNYQNAFDKWATGGVAQATTAAAFSGRYNPGFSNKVDAVMLNAFAKVYGFEFFGTYESANGRSKNEAAMRHVSQYAAEGIYRFGNQENLFLGLRYNAVQADNTVTNKIDINRFCVAGGWFVSKNVLMKMEIVNQQYKNFLNTDYRYNGKFNGFVMEAIVGF